MVAELAVDPQHGQLVGVLGGMGPAATADFYAKLVAATPAPSDQLHLRVVIWSDPRIPDRSAALIDNGPDPTRLIEQGALALAALGCGLIAVPCNTAHAFIPRIQDRVGVPIVHMVQETAARVHTVAEGIQRVGLLATTGTVATGLYQHALASWNVQVTLPSEEEQEMLMGAIRVVKAGGISDQARLDTIQVAHRLIERGAEALVLGCSEIPLLLPATSLHIPIVDSTLCLAEAVVARAWMPDQAAR